MFNNRWEEVSGRVLAGYEALRHLVLSGGIEVSTAGRTYGREGEYLTCCQSSGSPAPIVPDLLKTGRFTDAVPEVHKAMIEVNGPVFTLEPGAFRTFPRNERIRLDAVRQEAHRYDSDLLAAGMSPAATWDEFTMGWYVDRKRYWELCHGLSKSLGNDGWFDVVIPARHLPATNRVEQRVRFSAAGAVYSDQLQMQMAPVEVGATVNWSHALLGPLCALCANATSFDGRLLDAASARPQFWACMTAGRPGFRRRNNYFLDEWLTERDPNAFITWMGRFLGGDAVVDCTDDDPLNCLRLFTSKWPWVRPKYDVTPVPNIRLEIRGFDKQFTPEDTGALHAVLLGAFAHLVGEDVNVRDFVTPAEARYNFLAGAHYGALAEDWDGSPIAEHKLHWKGGRATARTIVREFILPWAERGLERLQFERDEVQGALYPLRRIAEGGQSGAEWIRSSVRRLKAGQPEITPREVGRALVLSMMKQTWRQESATADWKSIV